MKPTRQGVNDVIFIVRGGDDTSLHGKKRKHKCQTIFQYRCQYFIFQDIMPYSPVKVNVALYPR
jgi:hypothetical protein